MTHVLLHFALCAALLASLTLMSARAAPIGTALISVFSTVRHRNPFRPWSKQTPRDIPGSVVQSVKGTRIVSRAQVVRGLRNLKTKFVVIDFDGRGVESLISLPKATATEWIMANNDVRVQGFLQMLATWQGKVGAAQAGS